MLNMTVETTRIIHDTNEEYGHFIDAQLNAVNAVDAPGDEGAIFSALVQGKNLSIGQFSVLKAEDDSATFFRDDNNNSVNVEMATSIIPAFPSVSIGDVTVTEGEIATFMLSLSEPYDQPIYANYSILPWTAGGYYSDYQGYNGSVTFNPGDIQTTISVPTVDDLTDENTEKFFVQLDSVYTIQAYQDGVHYIPYELLSDPIKGIGTILDNDTLTSSLSITSLSYPSGTPENPTVFHVDSSSYLNLTWIDINFSYNNNSGELVWIFGNGIGVGVTQGSRTYDQDNDYKTNLGFLPKSGSSGQEYIIDAYQNSDGTYTYYKGVIYPQPISRQTPGEITSVSLSMQQQLAGSDYGTVWKEVTLPVNYLFMGDVDLAVTKSASVAQAQVGEEFTYTISITNNTSDYGFSADNVFLTEVLPKGVTFVRSNTYYGGIQVEQDGDKTSLKFSVSNISPSSSKSIDITVIPTEESRPQGNILDEWTIITSTNVASEARYLTDPNLNNNSVSEDILVKLTNVDLELTKIDSPDPVNLGNNLTYTLTVFNNSDKDATEVNLTETLPQGVNFVSSSLTPVSNISNSLIFDLGTLAAKATKTVDVIVTPTQVGQITNTASVGSKEIDSNPNDNTTQQTTEVKFDLVVNTNGDEADPTSGDGNPDVDPSKDGMQITLRSALQYANDHPGVDTITFNILGNLTISPDSPLPSIADAVIIDGNSQPGIVIDGKNAGANANGLTITAANSTIRGLAINNFQGAGISIEGSGGNLIEYNRIGTNFQVNQDLGNSGNGITILSANNSIQSNFISGNESSGVAILGSSSTNNRIENNLIGTDGNGISALGNTLNGIYIGDGNDNIVKNNLISGNKDDGIDIRNSSNNTIQKNRIGTDFNGSQDLGNGERGINIEGSNNTIGGQDAGTEGNTIAFNKGTNEKGGVAITSGTENAILGNSIFKNEGLGIDLIDSKGYGLSPNDIGDGDPGANQLQNYPVITSVTTKDGQIIFSGTLNSAINQNYRLEFFANNPDGQVFLGSQNLLTNEFGYINDSTTPSSMPANFVGLDNVKGYINGFEVSFSASEVKAGATYTVTATDSNNNTSEFFSDKAFESLKNSIDTIPIGATMQATFSPKNSYSLEYIKHLYGFDHFNWVQQITSVPAFWTLVERVPATRDFITGKPVSYVSNPDIIKAYNSSLSEPILDPIDSEDKYVGYSVKPTDVSPDVVKKYVEKVYEATWAHDELVDDLPFYLNDPLSKDPRAQEQVKRQIINDHTFLFIDSPMQGDYSLDPFNINHFISFETSLVGVFADGRFINWNRIGTNFSWQSNSIFDASSESYNVIDGEATFITYSYALDPTLQPPILSGGVFDIQSDNDGNIPPITQADKSLTVDEDASATLLNITAPIDADGDSLTIQITSLPTAEKGQVRLADGITLVSPNSFLSIAELTGLRFVPIANANGNAGTFSYTVSDGKGGTAFQIITLDITPVNDPPIANNDTATTQSNQPVIINILANDSDIDGNSISLSSFDKISSQNGTIIREENGTPNNLTDDKLLYTPAIGFSGTDSFSYTISDDTETSTAIVSITVNSVVNIFPGTQGRDTLTGTDLDDILIGKGGADILIGNKGKDQFVYQNIRDAGDIIKDFEINQDKIVLTDLLDSFGYSGSDPITDGYLKFGSRGSDAVILIDEDGLSGPKRALSFITVEGLGVGTAFDAMKSSSNFIF